MGVLADQFIKRTMLGLGFTLFGLLCLSFLLADDRKWILVVPSGGVGVYTAILESSQPALACALVPDDQHDSGLGLVSAANGVGGFLSGVTMGVAWAVASPNAGLAAAEGLAPCSAGRLSVPRPSRPTAGPG